MAAAPLHRPLLVMNFFAGVVTAGFGPYLAIYLLLELKWQTGQIGIALALGSLMTVILQTPAGAIIDWTAKKRGLLIFCGVVVCIASLMLVVSDTATAAFTAQALMGAALAFIAPLIAAITLGVVGHAMFTRQTGANQASNHVGNVVAAAIAAAAALSGYITGVFFLIALMAIGMSISLFFIKPDEIDHELARGGMHVEASGREKASGFKAIVADERLLIFAITLFLFHFANGAMLPLLSQEESLAGNTQTGIVFTAACIISARIMMVVMAVVCGRTADSWGRKPLFIFALAILPVRAVLYTLTDDPVLLVIVQSLDGVANGIFAIIFLLIISDVTKGTGRFNVVQGALATLVGVGTAASSLIAEEIVQYYGYDVAFIVLGGAAAVGLVVFATLMPETAGHALRRLRPAKTAV